MKIAVATLLVASLACPAASWAAEPSRFGSTEKPVAVKPAELNGQAATVPANEREPDTGPLAAALQERFRDRIAGIFIEREPDFHVVVRLTGNRDGGTLQYQLGDDRVRVEVRTGAPHTLAELQAVLDSNQKTINHYLGTAHARYVDERTGELVIAVDFGDSQSPARKEELTAELGVPVRIVERERAVLLHRGSATEVPSDNR